MPLPPLLSSRTFVELDELVTVVTDDLHIMRAKVVWAYSHSAGLGGTTLPCMIATIAKSREGIRWIRGHHAEDSEEAQALLATAALFGT